MTNVDEFLTARFAGKPAALDYYAGLWREYDTSGLADPHFGQEITSGDDGRFWSRVWEMVLYRHLRSLTPQVSSKSAGPDFRAVIDGTQVYFEAITPAPTGLPPAWLAPVGHREVKVRDFPHEAILLRRTAALKEKRDQFERHRNSGLIEDDAPTVIAVNSCRLSLWPEETGITQLPFAVEAVFPIGPIAMPIHVRTGNILNSYQSIRFAVQNMNGSLVPTDSFLNPDYAGVSALLGCPNCHASDGSPRMVVVHNPLARNPLPPRMIGAAAEYVTERQEDDLVIIRLGD